MSTPPVGVQDGALFTDTTIQVLKNIPHKYINCEFNRTTFNGRIAETKFISCRFNDAQFGQCTDTFFSNCEFKRVTFTGVLGDCVFSRCEIQHLHGVFLAERCRVFRCTLSNTKLRTRSRFVQCTIVDTQITKTTAPKSDFTDSTLIETTFAQCSLPHMTMRRCHLTRVALERCKTTNSAWGGNVWKSCVWHSCDDKHSKHVADEEEKCRYRNHDAQRCEYVHHKAQGGRYDTVDFAWTTWNACRDNDGRWIAVSLRGARVVNTIYHNTHVVGLQHTDTIYQNVKHTRAQIDQVKVHFYDAALEKGGVEPPVEITLYSQHRRLSSTTKTTFDLKDTVANAIDFVFVVPVVGFFASFGLSTPNSAHHLVSHVTVGKANFFPRKQPYSVAGEAREYIGYCRCRIKRSMSAPKLATLH